MISVAFILSTGVESLIVIRFVQGITSAMIMPVVQAYVGDITPAGKEGWIMGLFNMSLFIGVITSYSIHYTKLYESSRRYQSFRTPPTPRL